MSPPVGAAPVKWTLCVPLTQCQVTASPALIVTLPGAKTSPPWPTATVAGAAPAGAATASVARAAVSARGAGRDRRIRRPPETGGSSRERDRDGSGADSVDVSDP